MKQNKNNEPMRETTKTMSSDKQKVKGSSQAPKEKNVQNGKGSEDAEAEKGHA